jgi:hypothetical protein
LKLLNLNFFRNKIFKNDLRCFVFIFYYPSIIAFVISVLSSGKVAYGSVLAGYSALILGVMMILVILFTNILNGTTDSSSSQLIMSVLMTTGPFILMLGVIGFILYLLIVYKSVIIDGHVSPNYQTFSNIAIILFLIQVYIVYTNLSSDKFISTGKISKVTSSLIYLFGVLTLASSLILYTILKYFRTDG